MHPVSFKEALQLPSRRASLKPNFFMRDTFDLN
jgi:hypothetical protein